MSEKIAVDVWLAVEYRLKGPEVKIRTNIKREMVGEVLSDYVQDQLFGPEDNREPEDREVYNVKIGLRVADDAWGCDHDCGNDRLKTGILVTVLRLLHDESDAIKWVD